MRSSIRDFTERTALGAALREEVETLETLNRMAQQFASRLELRALAKPSPTRRPR